MNVLVVRHGSWWSWKNFVKRHIVDDYPRNYLLIDLRRSGFPASLGERVKAGMAQARRAGKRVGRPALRQFAPSDIVTMRQLRSQGTSVRKLATDFKTTEWMAARLTGKDAASGVSITQ